MTKTNVMRLLDLAHIAYNTREYEVDESDLSGVSAAKKLGLNPEEMFKTLVTRGDKNGVNVFCIPVHYELNLKKAAAISGNKKIEMVPMKEIEALTGYIRGGCSPIGMKKKFPTYVDETASLYDAIAVSAGIRGLQLVLSAAVLCTFVEGTLCDLL